MKPLEFYHLSVTPGSAASCWLFTLCLSFLILKFLNWGNSSVCFKWENTSKVLTTVPDL